MYIILLAVQTLTRIKEKDMGMNRHDAYYEPEDADDMDAALCGRIAELLNTAEYDPTDVSHMAEAIAEASEADQEIIRDFIANGEWHKLGMKLYYMSHEYMEKFAESHAIDNYNQGLLHD
jgi:hypothetical protein